MLCPTRRDETRRGCGEKNVRLRPTHLNDGDDDGDGDDNDHHYLKCSNFMLGRGSYMHDMDR